MPSSSVQRCFVPVPVVMTPPEPSDMYWKFPRLAA